MEKLDFKKVMKAYWQPPVGEFVTVDVPRLNFIKVDGKGDPNSATEYRTAVQWLYSMSYGLKFASKLVIYDSEMIDNSVIYPL